MNNLPRVVGFDGDDTLWHNERSYRDGRERFRQLLAGAGVTLSAEEIEAFVNRTELVNLDYYGYGVSSFVLSLIETAIALTDGRIAGAELRGIIALAKQMLTEKVDLFPGVRDVLTTLASSYPLMLITKGDLLHQTSKLERSGLRDCFRHVEVVSRKTADVYTAILVRHGIEPGRFLMIGNSLRSDVLPVVVEVGGRAVYIPAALSWSHEQADVPEEAKPRYFELPALERLPDVVEALEQSTPAGKRTRHARLKRSRGPRSTRART